jgi:iron complex outermembrane receptor protein
MGFIKTIKVLICFVLGVCCAAPLAYGEQAATDEDKKTITIVITASRNPGESSETTRSVSVLSEEEIKSAPVKNVAELLNYVQGVDLQKRGVGAQADLSIRGSTFEQVLVLIDGVRVNDPQTGHHNLDLPITINDVERIEVLRGHGSSLYGPDAFGGVINIITKKAGKRKVVLEGTIGEYDTQGAMFSTSYSKNDFGVQFSAEKKRSDGFRFDTDFDVQTFFAKFTLDRWGENALTFGGTDKEFGAYDFYSPGAGYPSREWTDTRYVSYAGSITKGEITIKSNLSYRRHKDKFVLDMFSPSFYTNRHTTDVYTGETYVTLPVSDYGFFTVGTELGKDVIDSSSLGDHKQIREAVFAEAETDLFNDDLVINGGARIDHYSTFGSTWSPSLSGRYRLNEFSMMHFSVGKSFRVPTFTDLYYQSPTNAGNPDLSPEKATSFEAGIEGHSRQDKVSCHVVVFRRDQKDLIDWIKQPPTATKWAATNITNAVTEGIEVETKIRPADWANLSMSYTFLDSDVSITGDYLSRYALNHPKHQFTSGLELKLPYDITQSTYVCFKDRENRDQYTITDVHVSKDIPWGMIFVDATNVFDIEYEDLPGIPQPGRWVTGGVRVEF